MQGRGSGKVRDFALYGETTGETDEFGLPIRYDWAAEYRGRAMVVYGHTPVPAPEWLNRTINIDTGCVVGGRLTAWRYPERELISVPAERTYAQPSRPFLEPEVQAPFTAQQSHDDLLDISEVLGKRIITTRFHHNVTIREENAIAALEVMSRFAANPKWLIYLPPTMSPSETTQQPGLLEHPAEGRVYDDKDHVWHMTTLARLCLDPRLLATPYKTIDVTDPDSQAEGVAWWEELTARGGGRNGSQTHNFCCKRKPWLNATCCQMPGTGISSHHIWTRIHCS